MKAQGRKQYAQSLFDFQVLRQEWPGEPAVEDEDGQKRLAALRKAARPGVVVEGLFRSPEIDISVIVRVNGRREIHYFEARKWVGYQPLPSTTVHRKEAGEYEIRIPAAQIGANAWLVDGHVVFHDITECWHCYTCGNCWRPQLMKELMQCPHR